MVVKIKKMGNHHLVKCSFNYKLNDNEFPGFKDTNQSFYTEL